MTPSTGSLNASVSVQHPAELFFFVSSSARQSGEGGVWHRRVESAPSVVTANVLFGIESEILHERPSAATVGAADSNRSADATVTGFRIDDFVEGPPGTISASGCGTCVTSTAHIADPRAPARAYPTRKRNEERFDPEPEPELFSSPFASVRASNGAARRCVTPNAPLASAAFARKNSSPKPLSGLISAIFSGRARRSTVQNATRPVASPEARRKRFFDDAFLFSSSSPSADQRNAFTPLLPACVTASSAHRRSRGDHIFNAPSSYATARSGFVGCHASAATETPPRSSGTASGRRASKGSPSSARRETFCTFGRQTCVAFERCVERARAFRDSRFALTFKGGHGCRQRRRRGGRGRNRVEPSRATIHDDGHARGQRGGWCRLGKRGRARARDVPVYTPTAPSACATATSGTPLNGSSGLGLCSDHSVCVGAPGDEICEEK